MQSWELKMREGDSFSARQQKVYQSRTRMDDEEDQTGFLAF